MFPATQSLLFSVILVLILLPPSGAAESYQQGLEDLFERYFSWKLRTWPTWASMKGYHDYDSEWEDLSLEGFERIRSEIKSFYEEAERMESSFMSGEEYEHYLGVLKWELGIALEGYQWKHYVFSNSNFLSGIFREIPLLFSSRGCLLWEKNEHVSKNLEKLKKIPRLLGQVQGLLSFGATMGLLYPMEAFDRIDFDSINSEQLKEMFQKSQNASLKAQAEEVIDSQVIPSMRSLGDYIQNEYEVRELVGISTLPNGKARYEAILKYHTSIDGVTAEEIHEIGLAEVARLRESLVSDVIRLVGEPKGFSNITVEDIFKSAREHPKMQFSNEDELLSIHKKMVHEKIYPKLPDFFHASILNEVSHVDVIADDKTGLSYYKTAAFDDSKNGSFIIGTQILGNQFRFSALSLSLHEAVPGHHLQFSYSQGEKFPKFLRNKLNPDFAAVPGELGSPTAFIEGWALYSEYLGNEMGLFEANPIQLLGYYSFGLLRASRLVVDTGLHGLGWTREEAINYLTENTGFTDSASSFEVDRYIVWPGQATSYKIGELKIRNIRNKMMSELGERFDLKDFHSAVLDCYGPLHLIDGCITRKMLSN